jgi:hypothetical protein
VTGAPLVLVKNELCPKTIGVQYNNNIVFFGFKRGVRFPFERFGFLGFI